MKPRVDVIVSVVLIVGLAVAASYSHGTLRDLSLVFIAAPVSLLYTLALDEFGVPIGFNLKVMLGIMTALFLVSITLLIYFAMEHRAKIKLYPHLEDGAIADGLIADFAAAAPNDPSNDGRSDYDINFVKTALGTRCSLLSDSTNNQESTIWYEWKHVDRPEAGGGFLRVHYNLKPTHRREPFVGIYCLLSSPPGTLFDVSRFQKLTYKIRASSAAAASHIRFRAVLYSLGLQKWQEEQYAYPTLEVPQEMIGAGWRTISADFDRFHAPPFVNQGVEISLDPHTVFEVGFLIVGRPNTRGDYPSVSGAIDIDDIYFE